jgi:hypothetical protein
MAAPPSNEDAVNHTTAERLNPTAVTAVGASATAALAGGAITTIETRTPSTAISAVTRFLVVLAVGLATIPTPMTTPRLPLRDIPIDIQRTLEAFVPEFGHNTQTAYNVCQFCMVIRRRSLRSILRADGGPSPHVAGELRS